MSDRSLVVHASRPRASPYYRGLIAGYAARGGPQMFTPWYPIGTEEYRLYSQGWDDGAGDWTWEQKVQKYGPIRPPAGKVV